MMRRGEIVVLIKNSRVVLLILTVILTSTLLFGCMKSGENDAEWINLIWENTDETLTFSNSYPVLDESLKTEYVVDDGSQVISYIIFDSSKADVSNIPFTDDEEWENNEEVKSVLNELNVPEEKRPQNITGVYQITETETDYPMYLWLLYSETDDRLYALQSLH